MTSYSVHLLERDNELAALRDAAGRARCQGALVMVRGAAGSGRTALLEAVEAEQRAAGSQIVHVRFGNGFEAVAEALRDACRQTPLVDLNAAPPAPMRMIRLVTAISAAVGRLAVRGPVTVLADDVDATPEMCLALSALRRQRVLVVAAAVAGDQLAAAADVVLDLSPLGESATSELLAARLGAPVDPALTTALRDALGPQAGNPSAVLETLAHLDDTGRLVPVHGWVALAEPAEPILLAPGSFLGLRGVTLDVLTALAIAPVRVVELPALAAAAGIEAQVLGQRADELVEAGIVRTGDDGRLCVAAPALAARLLADAWPERVAEVRRDFALALLRDPRTADADLADRVADAGDALPVLPALADSLYAWATAPEVEPGRAASWLIAAWRHARRPGLRERIAEIVLALLLRSGEPERLAAAVEMILDGVLPSFTLEADLAAAAAVAAVHTGRPLDARLFAGRHLPALVFADRWFGGGELTGEYLGEPDRGDRPLVANAELARIAAAPPDANLTAVWRDVLGDRYGVPRHGPVGALHRVHTGYVHGDLGRALSAARELELGPGPRLRDQGRLWAAEMCRELNDARQSEGWLATADTTAFRELSAWITCGAPGGGWRTADEAETAFRAAYDVYRSISENAENLLSRTLLAVRLLCTARLPEHVTGLFEDVQAIEARRSTPDTRLVLLIARALADHDPAAALEAVELARESGHVPLFLSSCFVAGVTTSEPGPLLQEAYEVAGRLGLVRAQGALRAIMRTRGVGLPRARPDHFSETELTIIEEICAGRTNREIARRTWLSEKTIEDHLSRLFARTGTRSRVQLAVARLGGRLTPTGPAPTTGLVGREAELDAIGEVLSGTAGVAAALVVGPAGCGRTTVLDEICRQADDLGLTTLRFRHVPQDRTTPYHLIGRLVAALTQLPGSRGAPAVPDGADGAGPDQVADVLAGVLRQRSGLAVLVDDAHWLDEGSREVIDLVVRRIGLSVRWVFTARAGVRPAPIPLVRRLLADEVIRVVRLPRLSFPAQAAMLADLINARPHDSLTRTVKSLSGGIPGAAAAALKVLLRGDSLHTAEGYGYLTQPDRPPVIRLEDDTARELLGLPDEVMAVAKAVAVLHPVAGESLAAVVAGALGTSPAEVWDQLALLTQLGLVVRRRDGPRFTVPLWSLAVDGLLRPYEKRQLAQYAVDELRSRPDMRVHANYVAEQVMRVQSAVDAPKLVTLGTAVTEQDAWSATWGLGAAVMPAGSCEPAALAAYAKAAGLVGDYETAARVSREVLDSSAAIPAGLALETQLVHVSALWGSRNVAAVSALVDGDHKLGDDAAHQVLVRASALCFQGRWDEAYRQLDRDREQWAGSAEAIEFGSTVLAAAGTITGRPAALSALLDPLRRSVRPRSYTIMLRLAVRVLLIVGETRAARDLLAGEQVDTFQLPALDQALFAWEQGRWDDALHHARMDSGTADVLGTAPAPVVVGHAIAAILLGRGRIAAARAALDAGRRTSTSLVQMLDVMDAAVAGTVGDTELAQRHVDHGLAYVRDHRIVPGAADLWLFQTELAVGRGDRELALRAAAAVRQAADEQQTERSRLLALLATTATEPDEKVSAEAVRLARLVGQPRTLARTLVDVANAGHGDQSMLYEAYEVLGELDALLYRHRLRRVMRKNRVVVPGRAEATAETDRLIATMVADGASHRDLAAAMQTSAKSVEGMLSRLFRRTGYRSRVDLVAAVLSGEYPVA